MVTGRDVARLAGVSQTTVSRAFRNDPRVSEETYQRIRQAAETLRYSPNIVARTLLTGSSKTVAIVVPDVSNVVNPQFIRAAQEEFAGEGYDSLLINLGPDDGLRQVESLAQRMVEGVLVAAASDRKGALIAAIDRQSLPVTLAIRGTDSAAVDSYTADDAAGCEAAAELFHRGGHTRVALISGPEDTTSGRNRALFFRAALAERGIVLHDESIRHGDYSFQSGAAAASSLMATVRPPTAIFCASDGMAFGALDALLSAGIRVPRDVSVIGFDDTPMASWAMIGLTTIRQPVVEMTRVAVRRLLQRMRGWDGPAEQVEFPVEMVERATTGPAPAART